MEADGLKNRKKMSDGQDLDFLISQIYEAIERRKYQEGKPILAKIFSLFEKLSKKKKSELLALSAKLSYWLGDYINAKKDANMALQLNVKNSAAHVILGKIALAEYFFSKAIGHFMSANESDPEACLGLARLYLKLRDVANARRYLLLASRFLPGDHQEYNLLQSYLEVLEGKNSSGNSRALRFLNSQHSNPDCIIIGAEVMITAGDYSSAKTCLQSLERDCPENDQAQGLEAYIHYAEEDFEGAEQSAIKALEKNAFNAMAMTIKMKIAGKKGLLSEAEAIGLMLLQKSPEYTLAHANLGDVYFLQGKYEQAMSEYQQADCMTKTSTKGAKLRQGRVEIINGNYEGARAMLEDLITVQGSYYDDALCDLAMVYELLGRFEKKEELLQRMEIRKTYSRRVEEALSKVRRNQ